MADSGTLILGCKTDYNDKLVIKSKPKRKSLEIAIKYYNEDATSILVKDEHIDEIISILQEYKANCLILKGE